jgi:hypothetical protein
MKEKLNPTEDLLLLENLQAKNFRANFRGLAEVLLVYDALYELTVSLQNVFWKSMTRNNGKSVDIMVMLYQFMRQDLVKSALALCSGYDNDSSFHTRRIYETAAIFIELARNPKKLEIYADLTTQKARDDYLNGFMVFRLVKSNLSKTSVDSYELLCLFVHPSFIASGRTDIENNRHVMRFFDSRTDDALPELRSTILSHLSMIYNAFKDLNRAFQLAPDFDQDAWDGSCKQFLQVLEEQLVKMQASGLIRSITPNEDNLLEEPD